MRLNMNLAALSALPIEEKRTELFNGIKGVLSLLPIAIDCIGGQAALKMAANDPNLIAGPVAELPSMDTVKAFLLSDRAAKHFGGQKWAVATDAPALINTANRIISFTRENLRQIDLGYTSLFRTVDMRSADTDTIEVATGNTAIVFEQTEYGGQIKINRRTGANITTLKMLTETGGIAILDDWLRFNKWYKVEEAVEDMYNGYAKKQADLHYGLLTATSAGNDVAFDTDLATTFNKAVAMLLRKLDSKGYYLGANVEVDIVVSPEKVGLVMAMLEARRGSPMVAYGTQKQPIAFGGRNVIVSTRIPAAANNFYVVVPEGKLVRAVWKDLTIESARAADYGATDWYGHGQYASSLGEQDQVARVFTQ